ncbi:MAG: DUF2357 domain-containing protein [Oscillospiraceae bacterium]|nr:DUF2357 domain-containing protein [Oscillospiraceae bacterium]
MAADINDLYLLITQQVGPSLENDEYFQYLYNLVDSGDNRINQQHKILHKKIDENWIDFIEQNIDAIFKIIQKPRSFIATKEEVVPVGLAKKITADSVRHLSMNTQFIASDEGGDIQPTRILNVSTEESFNLYENRFIYHLIQRLAAFINKRTDIIFWATGDEITDNLTLESSFKDAYEEVNYKIELNIKDLQNVAKSREEHMDLFKRIEEIQKKVRALRKSPFCQTMAGCTVVRSPIQRTNLMMKDPYYRTCYKLWQFIESYDDIGYTIDEQDTAIEMDEDYLVRMYTNLITNYTVFKSLTDGDGRSEDVLAQRNFEKIKPKFIKEIREEIVDDYNLPDVEVRRVLIEEVTQAQLDAEARLRKERAKTAALEQERERLRAKISDTEKQLNRANRDNELLQETNSKISADLESSLALQASLQRELSSAKENLQTEQTARQQAETAAKNAKERRILADRHREKAEKEMRQALREKQEALRRADDDRRRKIFAEKAAETAVKEREQFARNSKNAELAKQEAVSAMLEAQKLAKRMQNDIKGGEKRIQKLEKAKRKAEKRAKANSLSHYILQKLQARDRARENSQIPESDIPNKENNRQ